MFWFSGEYVVYVIEWLGYGLNSSNGFEYRGWVKWKVISDKHIFGLGDIYFITSLVKEGSPKVVSGSCSVRPW